MENIFLEMFQKTNFTKSQKKIAQYCIDTQFGICGKSLRQFAAEADVSEVSVLNFVRKLGYEGYAEFKEWVFDQMRSQTGFDTETNRSLTQRLESNRQGRSEGSVLESYLRLTLNNVEKTLLQNRPELYDEVADTLLKSKRIFVVGFRSAAGVAERFALGLQHLMKNIYYIDDVHRGLIQTLSKAGKGDTFFITCLSRYYKQDIAIFKMAKEQGVHIVALTDSAIAPVAIYADQLLIGSVDSISFFNSEIGMLAIYEYFVALLTERLGKEAVKESWDFIDAFMGDFRS